MVTQDNISGSTPMGANLLNVQGSGGATFRVWAPLASAVHLNGVFGGTASWTGATDPTAALRPIGGGHWAGWLAGAAEGDLYKFYVIGQGTSGYKRDPYARELQAGGNAVVRDPSAYSWHDASFVAPAYNATILYQLHIGTYFLRDHAGDATFLDVIEKIPYLAALGVNAVQFLPVNEFETDNSEGYNGSDYFAPEYRYGVPDPASPVDYLSTINGLLAAKGCAPLAAPAISSPYSQLKLLVDLFHLHGMAVHFDVVYNHAGGFDGDDDSIFFWDRQDPSDNNNSLYFTAQSIGPGGLPFALWKQEVQAFQIENAKYLISEFHIDGLRYDEISLLIGTNQSSGWGYCQSITGTLRYLHPSVLQNAEFWPLNPAIVQASDQGGAGFDATQCDELRAAVRGVIAQAAGGAGASVDLGPVAAALPVFGFPAKWTAVQCVENHDIVYQDRSPRMSALSDSNDSWSWYARSRSRVATGLLLTAPGIPQLFMGQEFLETKQWSDDPNSPLHIYWAGLDQGMKPSTDFLRFTQDLIALRRAQPALCGEPINVFYWNNADRVIAYQRWIDGEGRDVVVVASLGESTYYGYWLGFPGPGRWAEAFNSDIYDNWVNPIAAGNGGQVFADGAPMHGFGASASLIIPANSVLVFTR